MPKARHDTPASDPEAVERESFLAENRAARERIRTREEEKRRRRGGDDAAAGDPPTRPRGATGEATTGETAVDATTDENTDEGSPAGEGSGDRGADDSRVPRKLDEDETRRRRFRPRRPGRRAGMALLAVLVVFLAAATAVLGYAYLRGDDRGGPGVTDAERTVAMDTARRYAADLATYDPANYADLDRRITAISTPDFAKRYITSSQDARNGNANARGVSRATSNRAGVTSMTADKAVVLVTLDQTVNAPELAEQVPQGIPYQSRVLVTLVKRDGTWLLDDLETV